MNQPQHETMSESEEAAWSGGSHLSQKPLPKSEQQIHDYYNGVLLATIQGCDERVRRAEAALTQAIEENKRLIEINKELVNTHNTLVIENSRLRKQ